jgi:hypothetical protein
VCDCGRLRQTTGWEPTSAIRQSLHDVLYYWRGQVRPEEETPCAC